MVRSADKFRNVISFGGGLIENTIQRRRGGREPRGFSAEVEGNDPRGIAVPAPRHLRRASHCPAPLSRAVSSPTLGAPGPLRFRQLMEKNMDRQIRFDYTVTSSMIGDLITTFIESGGHITWCRRVRFYTWDADQVKKEVSYGATWQDGSTFYDGKWSLELMVDDEKEPRVLGWKKLKWALERHEMKEHTRDFLDENYDVNTADCLIQMAVFKEIVYG